MSNKPKPNYDHYLITESDDVSVLIRLRDIVLTVALWIIYLYFIKDSLPFVEDLLSWIGHGFDDIAQYPNLKIMSTIQAYGQVAGVMTVVYLGWAIYNMLRFRGRQRRKPRAFVCARRSRKHVRLFDRKRSLPGKTHILWLCITTPRDI